MLRDNYRHLMHTNCACAGSLWQAEIRGAAKHQETIAYVDIAAASQGVAAKIARLNPHGWLSPSPFSLFSSATRHPEAQLLSRSKDLLPFDFHFSTSDRKAVQHEAKYAVLMVCFS